MTSELLISVIVPVYNAEKFLDQCLRSLLAQGLAKEYYEIICVNDGSNDDSLEILKDYSDRNHNIVVIDQKNAGVSAARNKGLDVARGQYVWFVDADDWVAKDFLKNKRIASLFHTESMSVPLILTKCIDICEGEADKYDNYSVLSEALVLEVVRPFMTTARGHFFNRQLIEKYQLRFDNNLSYGEDLIFMREFLDVVRFENECGKHFKILLCDGCGTYLYRIHGGSAMGQIHNHIEKAADSILYRARWSAEKYREKNKPNWYTANYQEYLNLHMQEYMLYYFPALNKPMAGHLKELKQEGLFPPPPPKLGWPKEKNVARKIRQFVFKHSLIYPLYYIIMRFKFRKAGSA